MVIPVGGFFQELKVFTKQADGRVTEKDIIPVRFVPMTGEIEEARTPREQ
jgi:protein-L-isoaspartate(D-aspartate) O-methyltransferase